MTINNHSKAGARLATKRFEPGSYTYLSIIYLNLQAACHIRPFTIIMKTLPDHTQSAHTSTSSLLSYCRERDTLLRSARMALVVGTVLALINHGPALIAGRFTPEQLLPSLITYLVPFTVSLYSQVQGKRQRDLARASQ